MKKNDLDENQIMLLAQFVKTGGAEVKLIHVILKKEIRELRDVLNIDPRGNMGLQALARQEAVKVLENVFDIIFPELLEKKFQDNSKKINPYR